jgi:large subunit ribosomal protein L21
MYAVVNTGGKQYKVQQGEVLRVEKIPGDVGSPVTFDRVLMFSDGENISIGQPVLENVAVEGHIVEQGKAKKIIVFKYKKRKRYRRKQGHRQTFTAVCIDSIAPMAAKTEKPPQKAEKAQPEAAAAATEPEAGKIEAKETAPKKKAAKKTEDKAAAPAEETVAEKKPATKASATKKAVPQEKDEE